MKIKLGCILGTIISFVLFAPSPLPAQITAFTYQGRLNDNGQPANGIYDFEFLLFDAETNGGQFPVAPISLNVVASNGLFTTGMDFGTNAFHGRAAWLEIAVRPQNTGNFTTLSPRQAILSVPGAVFANSASNLLGTLPTAQLTGTIAGGSLPASPNFSGTVTASSFSGGGANLTALNANNISGGVLSDGILSTNVARRDQGNTFSSGQTFNGLLHVNNAGGYSQSSLGTFSIDAPLLPGGRFLVSASGNVGIGTNNPGSLLDVAGDTRIQGTVQMGSGTGTSETPDHALVIRRVVTRDFGSDNTVARTDKLLLQRDDSNGGWKLVNLASPGNNTVAATGLTATGVTVNKVLSISSGAVAGTNVIFTSAQNVISFHCTFGDSYVPNHWTEVSLTRFNGDFTWTGTLTSTFNQ